MQAYETLLITKPALEKEAIATLVGKVTAVIAKNGGEHVKTDEWGSRRLAYEIKKNREGYYILFEFGGEKATVRKVEDYLNLQADVIRYLTTKKVARTAPRPSENIHPIHHHDGEGAAVSDGEE